MESASEPENLHDSYAVQVIKDYIGVGHVPRDISKYCTTALLCGGNIRCEVTGRKENKRRNGLEFPCEYMTKGPSYMTNHVEMLIKDY